MDISPNIQIKSKGRGTSVTLNYRKPLDSQEYDYLVKNDPYHDSKISKGFLKHNYKPQKCRFLGKF